MKRRLNSPTPYLRWQYLTFEHNVHEVPAAIAFAREIGFDSFNLATPTDTDEFAIGNKDAPPISVQYAGPQEHCSVQFNSKDNLNFVGDLTPYRGLIEAQASESFVARWVAAGCPQPQAVGEGALKCDWLNMAVCVGASGVVAPCNIGNYKWFGTFDFANVRHDQGNIMNSDVFQQARLLHTDRIAFERLTSGRSEDVKVSCLKCPHKPKPQAGLGATYTWFSLSPDPDLRRGYNDPQFSYLTDWSQHYGSGGMFC
jgi:hypothetical protein